MKKWIVPVLLAAVVCGFAGCVQTDEEPATVSFSNLTSDYSPAGVRIGDITLTTLDPLTTTVSYSIAAGSYDVSILSGGIWTSVITNKTLESEKSYVISVSKSASSYRWTLLESM